MIPALFGNSLVSEALKKLEKLLFVCTCHVTKKMSRANPEIRVEWEECDRTSQNFSNYGNW